MDPNRLWFEINSVAGYVLDHEDEHAQEVIDLAQMWADLDDLIKKGSALPAAWQRPADPIQGMERSLVLDCSHLSADDLDRRIVAYAVGMGWSAPEGSEPGDLRWDADCALDWLNDHAAPEGYAYEVEGNSLFLSPAYAL